jgi:hypothetical protein
MPVLLTPLALAALLAGIVPLAIHLARRTETVPIDFAALRWLRARPKPRHRPRFDELWLLALRLALVALLALWLANPALPGSADRRPVTAFAPGTTPFATTGRRLWLAPGFPAVETGDVAAAPVDSLVRELDATLPAGVPLTLVVPERLIGVDAERPRLSRAVTWRVVPGGAAGGAGAAAPSIAIRWAPERAAQARWFRAAAIGWGRPATDLGDTARGLPGSIRHVVWLAGGPLPEALTGWVARGGTALVPVDAEVRGAAVPVWRDLTGLPLAEAAVLGRGRIVRLTRDLTPAAMPVLLDPRFPEALRAVLAPLPAPARVLARDHAPLTGGPAPAAPVRDLRLPLALAIALLWLAERWLATRRARAVMP